MKNKQNIAMRCNQEQFESIKPKLERFGSRIKDVHDFESCPYLTNNLRSEWLVSNIGSHDKNCRDRIVHEQWNEKVFLEACGIETTPTLEEVKEYFKNAEKLQDNCDGEEFYLGEVYCLSDRFWSKDINGRSCCLWDNKGYAKIISYKQPKFEITKEQIKQIQELSLICKPASIVSKLKEWFPQVFEEEKAELVAGKWYKLPNTKAIIKCLSKPNKDGRFNCYGFNVNGKYIEEAKTYNDNGYKPATPQEVEQALTNEAVKLGLVIGEYCNHPNPTEEQNRSIKDYFYNERDNCLYGDKKDRGGARLFQNGIWATIIPTKTKEEAERLLNCKIV
jgi:hypothetical protein